MGRFIFIIIVAVVGIGVWSAGSAGIGVDPECKEAMDSYEEFFDEYVEFMEKYENSGNRHLCFQISMNICQNTTKR